MHCRVRKVNQSDVAAKTPQSLKGSMTNKSLKIKRSGSGVVLEISEHDLKGKIASKQISLNDSYYDEGGKKWLGINEYPEVKKWNIPIKLRS